MARPWSRRAASVAVVEAPAVPPVAVCRLSPSADLDRCVAIEAESHDHPWLVQDWRRVFKDPRHGGLVATAAGRAVGLLTYQLDGHDAVVSNLAVEAAWRRRGVGRALLGWMLGQPAATFNGERFVTAAGDVYLYCHEEDLGFQCFLRACGVRAVATYRRYYKTDGRDCILFKARRQVAG